MTAPTKAAAGWKKYIWPVIGFLAIAASFWMLKRELEGMSWSELWAGITAISALHWIVIALCTCGCYVSLAFYDGLALEHLKKKISFPFYALCALTTYALSHNIGASAFTGAVIRYRAYTAKGLNGAEVGILVTFCSLTFSLGVMILFGLAFLISPELEDRLGDLLTPGVVRWLAGGLLALVALYVLGSALRLPDLRIRNFVVSYPRLSITLRQLFVGPIEMVFAGGILYAALPELGNPGFIVVLGVFVVAFALALLSHAPGGLGVFELAVLTGLPEFAPESVLAALIVFRMCYFLIPLLIGLVMVALFEHGQLKRDAGSELPEG